MPLKGTGFSPPVKGSKISAALAAEGQHRWQRNFIRDSLRRSRERVSAVSLPLWLVSNISLGGVTHISPVGLLTYELEPGLLFRTIDQEGELHRFPAVGRVKSREPNIAITISPAALRE